MPRVRDARTGSGPTIDYWSMAPQAVLESLGANASGLTPEEAARRLEAYGYNEVDDKPQLTVLRALWNQVKSPLVLILFVAALISGLSENWTEASIVLAILLGSTGLGFWREYSSNAALEALARRIQLQANLLRAGQPVSVPAREVVPGDILVLTPGVLVPADALVLSASELFLDQAVVTGESFAVEKKPSAEGLGAAVAYAERSNYLFQGTNVHAGRGLAVIVKTGRATSYAAIVKDLAHASPETEFDRGLRTFSTMLLNIMLVMVLIAFIACAFMGRSWSEALMFAVALAVGLSPELLPAIVAVNLARSATLLAHKGMLVRRLNAIENLGSMDIICTDKTGTLTEGTVVMQGAFDCAGRPSPEVFSWARANALLQSGLPNPLDQSILDKDATGIATPEKIGEVPYDFVRKRLSVVITEGEGARLVTKGALDQILDVCVRLPDGRPLSEARAEIEALFQAWSGQGMRVLGVATRDLERKSGYAKDDEREMILRGFITFADQPKGDVAAVIRQLDGLGVRVKVITGDNRLVARHVATQVGLEGQRLLTGEELDTLDDEALGARIESITVFSQMNPSHKERIIRTLRTKGHVVGYMGDGINDTPAMHAADASISVESAVDVAKATADFVLLEKDLEIIKKGIEEGRKTFGNTQKYILLTTSANLGNMISMAFAALALPFLPMLASQILLNNFLSDVPAVGLAEDAVDADFTAVPRRWEMRFVRSFMIQFGLVSSLFDLLAFAMLLLVFRVTPEVFRTAWFLESLLTELAVTFILRTRRRFDQSRPGRLLVGCSIVVAAIGLLIPFLPVMHHLGFQALPWPIFLFVILLTLVYAGGTEWVKKGFYRRYPN